MKTALENVLIKNKRHFYPVVEFQPTDKLFNFDFTDTNTEINDRIITDTIQFSKYINDKLQSTQSRYGIGGYAENRVLYRRSNLFDSKEPRTIHLGIDIWAAAGTKVFAALGGMVHSFAFNNNFGDYGATIILQHQLDTISFYTLYGHLSFADIKDLRKGKFFTRGECIGHFGNANENGNWPPHLHFQIIEDIGFVEGDYPGVCKPSEKEKYLNNCTDPDLILGMINDTATI